MDDALRREAQQPLGALEGTDLGIVQQHLRRTAHLQQIAGLEIDEHQPGPRVEQDIAQGVEEQIAGKVRDGQRSVFVHAHETRLAAAMRGIDLPLAVTHHIGGDIKRIGRRHQAPHQRVRDGQLTRRNSLRIDKMVLAQIDVARAVAVGLAHGNLQPWGKLTAHEAVHAITSPSVQFDPQHADGIALAHAFLGRVVRLGLEVDVQGLRIG
jgi:hypothetical protein